ncbi:hypothetical protein PFAG_02467 [Plasmodium falciparum Santa Lucia]|uniref:Uncharacterized protein n=1 Tax=Plasmodium falciparum Santa Lucia TaxID=478859 RepID=W7FW50_PLAFA|nr:hypothetical protein PFAG_02467 [Plasmodium falciparum Santa Lucia]
MCFIIINIIIYIYYIFLLNVQKVENNGKYKWRQINGLFIYILYNCNFSLKFYKYKYILCDNTKCDSLKSIVYVIYQYIY